MEQNWVTFWIALVTTLPAILASLAALVASLRNAKKIDVVHQEVKRDVEATTSVAAKAVTVKADLEEASTKVKADLEKATIRMDETLLEIKSQGDSIQKMVNGAAKSQGDSIQKMVNGAAMEKLRIIAILARRVATLSNAPGDASVADMVEAEYKSACLQNGGGSG